MELDRGYKSRGLVVVGISMEIPYERLKGASEAWPRVTQFIAAHHINYSIVMGDDDVTKDYRITALPATFLIDRAGRIAAEYPGVVDKDDVERNIKALLNEQ
jgi:peroxiredoxin